MLMRTALLAVVISYSLACHEGDPPIDIVRVPSTAYASSDGGTRSDGAMIARARDGGPSPMVLCIPELDEPGEEDQVSSDFSSCLLHHEGRNFDQHATERHRKKDSESNVCCYRRGRPADPWGE